MIPSRFQNIGDTEIVPPRGGELGVGVERAAGTGTAGQVFLAFLKLGLTSFGGPIAHLGYFRDEIVVRRRWMGEAEYADLVALCQFLPGPASSQVGFALGLYRAGPLGALAAWTAFTLPSALMPMPAICSEVSPSKKRVRSGSK